MDGCTKHEQVDFTNTVNIKQEKDDDFGRMTIIGQGNEEHIFTETYKIPIKDDYIENEPDPLSTNTEYSNSVDDLSMEEIVVKEALYNSDPEEEANQHKEKNGSDKNNGNGDDSSLQDANKFNKYHKIWKVLYPEVDIQKQKDIYQENNGNIQQTMDEIKLLNEEHERKKFPAIHAYREKNIWPNTIGKRSYPFPTVGNEMTKKVNELKANKEAESMQIINPGVKLEVFSDDEVDTKKHIQAKVDTWQHNQANYSHNIFQHQKEFQKYVIMQLGMIEDLQRQQHLLLRKLSTNLGSSKLQDVGNDNMPLPAASLQELALVISNGDFKKKFLMELDKIEDLQQHQLSFLQDLLINSDNNVSSQNFDIVLSPATTLKELMDLSSRVSDAEVKRKMINYMVSKLNCKTPGETVRHIMKNVAINDVMGLFSYKGRKKKRAFEHLHINKCILKACRKIHPDVQTPAIESLIAKTLLFAPHREKRKAQQRMSIKKSRKDEYDISIPGEKKAVEPVCLRSIRIKKCPISGLAISQGRPTYGRPTYITTLTRPIKYINKSNQSQPTRTLIYQNIEDEEEENLGAMIPEVKMEVFPDEEVDTGEHNQAAMDKGGNDQTDIPTHRGPSVFISRIQDKDAFLHMWLETNYKRDARNSWEEDLIYLHLKNTIKRQGLGHTATVSQLRESVRRVFGYSVGPIKHPRTSCWVYTGIKPISAYAGSKNIYSRTSIFSESSTTQPRNTPITVPSTVADVMPVPSRYIPSSALESSIAETPCTSWSSNTM